MKERDFSPLFFLNSFYLLLKRKNVYNDVQFSKRACIFCYWHALSSPSMSSLKTETLSEEAGELLQGRVPLKSNKLTHRLAQTPKRDGGEVSQASQARALREGERGMA